MGPLVREAKVDRGSLTFCRLDEAPKDREYWMTRTIEERLEGIELMRQISYGYDPTTERLQRVLEIVEFKRR